MRTDDLLSQRFELGAVTGAGAMGTVYRAEDRSSGRPVAVKLLKGCTREELLRFEREAEILRRLEDPGIVRFIAHGATPSEQPYIVLEWVEGEALSQRLRRGPMGLAESIVMAARIAGALQAAHAIGILHRDIKPGNLILTDGDPAKVRVLDFGIARLGDAPTLTVTGTPLGTPGYMAPEQAHGVADIDARCDVYGLGCVLFHALAGRPPYQAGSMLGALLQSVVEDAPRLCTLVPSIPRDLDHLVARMLARDRDQRPASAAEVVDALRAIGPSPRASRTLPIVEDDTLTSEERRATCLLVARGPRLARSHEAMRPIAAGFDADAQRLVDGTVVLTFRGAGSGESSVLDVARRAGRAALSLSRAFDGTHVVVVTARTTSTDHGVSAEALRGAISTAASVLEASASFAPAIRVDELTAGLLDPSFVLLYAEGAARELAGSAGILSTERDVGDAGRMVLGRPTPCVGREDELSLLEGHVRGAFRDREARVAKVIGEAGAGKTRVRHELLRRLADVERLTVWIGGVDSMSSDVPFALLGVLLRRAAGITDDVPASRRVGRIAALVAERIAPSEQRRVTAFIAELAGIPLPDVAAPELRAARQSPVLMFDHLRRAWVELVCGQCAAGPLMLVLEDLQWSDPPSLRFTEAARTQASSLPLMVLALARPDVEQRFPRALASPAPALVRLAPLSSSACAELARAVLPASSWSPALEAELAERSAGNAFYLEELLRAVARGRTHLPETAVAMAESRLEDLSAPERRALRAASVFGASFWMGGLAALVGDGPGSRDVAAITAELIRRELVVQRSTSRFADEAELTFRHALIREAAYASLTDEDRRRGHKRAASWLEPRPESDPAVIAEHFDRAGEPGRAGRWYARAAELALDANELDGALGLAQRGLERCGASSSGGSGAAGELAGRLRLVEAEVFDWRAEYGLERERAELAMAQFATGSDAWARAAYCLLRAGTVLRDTARVEEVASEMLDIAKSHQVVPSSVAYALLSTAHRVLYTGQYDLADRIRRELSVDRLDVKDARVMAMRHISVAARAAFDGDFGETYHEFLRAIELAESVGDLRTAAIARINGGVGAARLGRYDEALQMFRAAQASAEDLGLARVLTSVHNNLAHVLEGLGRSNEAVAEARVAVSMASAQNDARKVGGSRIYLACALLSTGALEDAEREALLAAEDLAATKPLLPHALAWVARAALARGRFGDALAASSKAMDLLAELGKIEEGEVTVRLAHVEALRGCGLHDDARRALDAARTSLLEHASKIHDHELRASFLLGVRDNTRTLQLANETPVSPDSG